MSKSLNMNIFNNLNESFNNNFKTKKQVFMESDRITTKKIYEEHTREEIKELLDNGAIDDYNHYKSLSDEEKEKLIDYWVEHYNDDLKESSLKESIVFNHIDDVWNAFENCKTLEEIEKMIDEIPRKFGVFSVDIVNDGKTARITNEYEEYGNYQSDTVDFDIESPIEEQDLSKDLFGDEAERRNAQYQEKYNKDLQYVKDIMTGKTVIDDKYHEELDLDTAKTWLKKDYIYLNNLLSADPDEVNKKLAKDLPEIFGTKVEEAASINSDLRNGKEERLASLKTQLEQDGGQLADDEKAAIEDEIVKLEGELYQSETSTEKKEEIEGQLDESKTSDVETFVAKNQFNYNVLGLIVDNTKKEFQVVNGQTLPIGKYKKLSKTAIWKKADELKSKGYTLIHTENDATGVKNLTEEVNEDAISRLLDGDTVYFRDRNGTPFRYRYAEKYENPEDYDDSYKPEHNGSGEDLATAKKAAENGEVWEFVEVDEGTLEPINTEYFIGYAYGVQELKDYIAPLREVKVIKRLEEKDLENDTYTYTYTNGDRTDTGNKVKESIVEDGADFKIGDIVKVPYKYGSYTPGKFIDAPIINIEDNRYITVEVPSKLEVTTEQLRKWNTVDESLKESNNTLTVKEETKIVEAEVKGLKEVKSQGNIYMLEDETNKFIVGENYNKEEGLIESAEIYDNKEDADEDYLNRCNITRDGEKVNGQILNEE